MTTNSDNPWFAKTSAEILAAVESRAGVAWGKVPGYGRYEWSDKGGLRRVRDGYVMKTGSKVNNSGYVMVNVTNDDGKPVTVTIGPMVLLAHHPEFRGLAAFPDGLETRHGPAGPLCNAYPENLWPGTKKQNAADKDPQDPQFPCRNHLTCGNMVHNEGRRCTPCTEAVGRKAAVLLDAGANLMKVATLFGYTGPDWVHKLAVKHGGYQGTKAEALAQHPVVGQRLRLRILTRGCDAL